MAGGLDEIGKIPERAKETEAQPTGANLFITDLEQELYTSYGREHLAILSESFLLYQIDLEKTQTDLYGQSKKKIYKPAQQIFGRINVEAEDNTYYVQGNISKKGMGKLTASVYIEELADKGLLKQIEGIGTMVFYIRSGDFIWYKGQSYKIINNGYSQIGNQNSMGSDRRIWIKITAIEVDEDVFKGR